MALSHVLLSMRVHPKWLDRVLSVKGRAQLSYQKATGLVDASACVHTVYARCVAAEACYTSSGEWRRVL